MRRIFALLAAILLVVPLTGPVLASGRPAHSSMFADVDYLDWDGSRLGHVVAWLGEPSDLRLVPGRHDFVGAADNAIRESHAVIGASHFWYDPDHLPAGASIAGGYVARGEGAECVYFGPNDVACHAWTVRFVDNVDPSVRDEVMFEWQNPDGTWGATTQFLGRGVFLLRFSGSAT